MPGSAGLFGLAEAVAGRDQAVSAAHAGSTVVTISQPHPHSAADLALAPVLINIEQNLAPLRSSTDLELALALDLNDDGSWYSSAEERAQRVLKSATRDVDLHGWTVTPTPDHNGLAVSHGEYTVSVMLGAQLAAYVQHGARSAPRHRPDRHCIRPGDRIAVLAATSLEWAVCDFAIWAAGVVTSLMPPHQRRRRGAARPAHRGGHQARLPPADRQVRPARQGADPADDHRRNRGLH